MPMPYSAAEITAALTASSRVWQFRYDRLDATNVYIGPLDMTGSSIAHAALADKIKRMFTGGLSPDATFNYSSDRMRVYVQLRMADGFWQEWPLGTFLLSTSATARSVSLPRGVVPVTGYDLLQVLVEDSFDDRWTIIAGSSIDTAVNTVLTSAGFSFTPTSGKFLPATMEWPPGTPKLTIVNALLSAINYTTLSMDANGSPYAVPYLTPSDATVLWSYSLDTASLVRPGTTTTLDLFSVPNVIVGYVSQPDRPVLRSVAVNADPTSPLSTVRRARRIVRVLDQQEIGEVVDQATLDAKVSQVLAGSAQQYETIEFSTGIMPQHNDADVITLNYGAGANRYRETGWRIELKAGGVMTHSARRAVAVG